MKSSAIFVAVIGLILFGCGDGKEEFSALELEGAYVTKYENETDHLYVYKNGTYRHEFLENGELVKESGNWRFLGSPTETRTTIDVVFEGFRFRPSLDLASSRGDWVTEAAKVPEHQSLNQQIKNSEAKIHLCFQTRLQWCFIKITE